MSTFSGFIKPQDQVFWYLRTNGRRPLYGTIDADVVVVGGGMAGISAAHAFCRKGKKVVLLDQYYCGSGASGKSSGFITPNSELSLTHFVKYYGPEIAQRIWKFIISGSDLIRSNIENHNIICDYVRQNTLMLANRASDLKELRDEYKNLQKLGFATNFIEQDALKTYVNTTRYYGGLEYFNSFGISGYLYCQHMKKIIQDFGAEVFEETPVISIDNHGAITPYGRVNASYIIVCADRFIPRLHILTKNIFQMQTLLAISESLTDDAVKLLFPKNTYMVWDTDLVYTYYRMSTNNRLLIGGGTPFTTYVSQSTHHSKTIERKLYKYLRMTFPRIDINLMYLWPGLIGVSKDLAPLMGRDPKDKNIFYVAAAAGLPIAAACGTYSAEHLLDGRDDLDL